MRHFLFIVLVMFSSSTFARIGDAYNCKLTDGISSFQNKLVRKTEGELNDPILSQDKFVWLEDTIVIKYVTKDLSIPIETQFYQESFEAYDGYHRLSFSDGLLIWSFQGHHPSGFGMRVFDCKKF